MSLLKTGGLALVFTLAADVAMAGGLGMVGVHGYVVDAGVSLGEAWDVPQVDWINLWENWDLTFLDPATDPCLSQGGHYHGDVCHIGSDDKLAQLGSSSALTPVPVSAPAPSIANQPLTFEP